MTDSLQDVVADALDCFWNAAIGATRQYNDSTANAVIDGIVSGVSAVANRLREHDLSALAAPNSDGASIELLKQWRDDLGDDPNKFSLERKTLTAAIAALSPGRSGESHD